MNRIKLIKSIHLYISIIIFFSLLIFSLFNKGLNILDIPLSKLGVEEDGWIWNSGLLLITFSLYFKIKDSILKFTESLTLQIINRISILSLFLTAVINMDHLLLHNIVAFSYFIGTSVLIFLFGIKMHRTNFRIGQVSLFIGIFSTLLPSVSFTIVGSLGIPEIIHVLLLFLWLMVLEHDDVVINILKKIGL